MGKGNNALMSYPVEQSRNTYQRVQYFQVQALARPINDKKIVLLPGVEAREYALGAS
jgi:hypothetical protein